MTDKKILVICSCCGAEGGDRDRANGRCGICGSFFAGNEAVVESVVQEVARDMVPEVIDARPQAPAVPTTPAPPDGSEPSMISDSEDASEVGASATDSEGLVKPRQLSPQFRRHIEMTWQPALRDDAMGAERTLSSESPADGTKRDTSSLSIGTRKITPEQATGGGDYELNEIIGEGSMGRVWSARQTSLDRNVAVKVPRPELANAGSVGESQFISEVVVTGKLEHPNIVPIYELGRDTSGVPFYSMKHVQGRPWNELIEEKSERENLEILMKVCDAIAFAHDRDFLHRDIKPHNVMVGEFGEVSVMDWGIAVSLSQDPTRAWAAVASGPAGTPAYMAPEMAAHNPSELGVVSDVYLLGAVLYEIVTGSPPHPRTGDTNEALLAAAANEIVPAGKTGELVDVARRAMATNLDDRYESVKLLQEALREYQSHRQSISLAESADQHLVQAIKKGSSDEYARSRFAYEEALKMWAGNGHATDGLRAATVAHAQNALKQENFELGISILDPDKAGHREILLRLERKRAARRRLAWVAKIAGMTAIGAILIVVVVVVGSYLELQSQKEVLQQSNIMLTSSEDALKGERDRLNDANQQLDQTNASLDDQRKKAMAAQKDERQAKLIAQRAERNAEEASYASDIGFAAESIRRNAFAKATSILQGLAQADSIRSKLRHIEWGLLQYSSSPRPVQDLLPNERIAAVASSVDGKVIAAGSEDGRVFVWVGATDGDRPGQRVEIRHGTRVNSIVLSDDGRYLATGGVDDRQSGDEKYVVRIWEIKDGQLDPASESLEGHTAEVLSVVFSKDASRVLTSAADRTAVVWSRSTGERLATIRDHLEKKVWSASFDPSDMQKVVTACEDGRVRVWRINDGSDEPKKLDDFRGHDGPVYAAVFSRDGQTVISGGYDRKLLRWQVRPASDDPGERKQNDLVALLEGSRSDATHVDLIGTEDQQHEASIRSISTGSVGQHEYIVTGGNDNTLRVWKRSDQSSWEFDKVLRGHGRWVQGCVFSGSGQTVLSGADDGLKLWTWQNYSMPRELYPISERRVGKEPSELGLPAAAGAVASGDGRWIATAYTNGTVGVWDVSSGDQAPSELLVDGHAFLTADGTFYDDGRRLLTSASDNTTRLWSVGRGTQSRVLEGTGWRGAAAVTWDMQGAEALIVTGSDDRLVPAWLWRVKDGVEIAKEPLLEDFAQSILDQQTGAGNVSAVSDSQEAVIRSRSRDPEQLRRTKRGIPDVTVVAFSASGDRFLIGNSLGRCFLYQIESGTTAVRQVKSFEAHGSTVRAAAFLPSGESVITASVDGELKQWGTTEGKLQRQLPWSAPVTSLAISEDGQFLLVGNSPVEGESVPVARLLKIDGSEVNVEAELSLTNPSGTRDWQDNQPIVQSVRFAGGGDRAIVSLFFPNRHGEFDPIEADGKRWAGYELGYWNWKGDETEFQPIRTTATGEISSATIREGANGREGPNGAQLLVVGGNGARLLATDAGDQSKFTNLVASFRAATSMTTVDFSFDRPSRLSHRLAAGDTEGNVRVWERLDGRWSESGGAAVQLTGHHVGPIVATDFDPLRSDRLLTADKTGKWIIWRYDQGWLVEQQYEPAPGSGPVHCVMFSPDGDRVFVGADDHAIVWHRNDLGQYEMNGQRWETGTVRSATFSADGSLIVITDGEQLVSFWDASGERVASLSDEDTKGIKSMALSWDGRRLFTGHRDKRVLVWDAGKLVDSAMENRDENEKIIKVLLTLEEHRRSVTSVAVSPNGRHLLTADEEGRTIISAGDPITPISITQSRDQFTYDLRAGVVRVDPWVTLNDPSRLADFGGAVFTAELEGDLGPHEQLAIGSSPATGVATIDVIEGGDGERFLSYRPYRGAKAVRIGVFLSPASDTTRLRVAFNAAADAVGIEAMLRRIAYGIVDDDENAAHTMASVGSTNMDELAGLARKLTIEISEIRYRDDAREPSVEVGEASDAVYPTSLSVGITIDVDSDAEGNVTIREQLVHLQE